ncbi:Two-component response regulator (fragment) [Candidatus Sulfotelmatomonas gaucii]|uniref:Two-component response regulator n=1 Tax=Candidatus Sulfuritelmatomonas gaucii TaxID=2043161 RepID=A0A2N9LM14_9BACT
MKSSLQSGKQAEEALSQAIDRLWVRFFPEIRERVAVLESAATAVSAKKLSAARREKAQAAAHKLAGVLGTFSLARGTVLARELEVIYSQETSPGSDSGERLAEIAAELRAIVENRPSTS